MSTPPVYLNGPGPATGALELGDYAPQGSTMLIGDALNFLESILMSDCINTADEYVNIRYSGGAAVVLPPQGNAPLSRVIRQNGGYSTPSRTKKFEIIVTLFPNHGGGLSGPNGGTSAPLNLMKFSQSWNTSALDAGLRNDLILATFPGVDIGVYSQNKAKWQADQAPPTPFKPEPI